MQGYLREPSINTFSFLENFYLQFLQYMLWNLPGGYDNTGIEYWYLIKQRIPYLSAYRAYTHQDSN